MSEQLEDIVQVWTKAGRSVGVARIDREWAVIHRTKLTPWAPVSAKRYPSRDDAVKRAYALER